MLVERESINEIASTFLYESSACSHAIIVSITARLAQDVAVYMSVLGTV